MAVLNDTTVRRARPRRTKYELTCDAVRGFVLRVLPSGRKVYLVRHRPEGRDVRVQIGPAETMSCDAARAKALEILRGQPSEAAQTSPPATLSAPSPVPESMIIERAPRPQRSRVPKLAEFAARYDREHIARHTKPRTQERYRQQLRMYLIPTLGDLVRSCGMHVWQEMRPPVPEDVPAIFLHAGSEVERIERMVAHLDVTVVAESPKIGPHREAMRARIAGICGLALDRVGVKATTSEGLGFTGRREGIAAHATATVRLPFLSGATRGTA